MNKNILFICSKNIWRSPTAEFIAKTEYQLNAKSAGISSKAQRKISNALILWAEIIFVMEEKHLEYLQEHFGEAIVEKDIRVLDIPDVYKYMDPELVILLRYDLDFLVR